MLARHPQEDLPRYWPSFNGRLTANSKTTDNGPMYAAMSRIVFAVGRVTPGGIQLLGTATLLNKPGHFVTASHVPAQNDQGLVIAFKELASLADYQDTSDSQVKMFPVRIHATDPFHDLAILKADNDLASNMRIAGADAVPVGADIATFGYPHADHGRLVLTQQNAEIGARILINSGGIKAKHLVLNIQARPGQSGSPVISRTDGTLVGIVIGSYAPGGGKEGISLGGINPHTLHQTTHAVSAEYVAKMV
jgi:S1-C subfamily serine protease